MNKQICVKNYKANGFVAQYQKLVTDTVIPYQYAVLCDEAENVEKSHVIKNFINAGKAIRGEDVEDGFYGMIFQDSDAGKWLEAVAYSLINYPDENLEKKADTLIEYIEGAQDTDGYLNTAFTIKDRDRRWTNLLEGHELYCAGHLIEAACAYYEATGKDRLLRVMEKNVEHIYRHFIVEKNEGYPGHPEIELALLRMYELTGNIQCFKLAEHFINVRGQDKHFYEKEKKKRDWQIWGNDPSNYSYQQSHAPVREQTDAEGHAVRAVYLYTGMAHLAFKTKDEQLFSACKTLWKSITKKRMYITGGIGSTGMGEAFTVDYDLPSDTAYAETCASVGLMFFASQMLRSETNRIYADVMERAFYNTVLAGMQLDGKKFFYVNPLEVIPGISGKAVTHLHDLTTRPGWYACACCPPNVARLIASFGKYAYSECEDTSFCHLYAAGKIAFDNGMKIVCETDYPYDFTVKYHVETGGNLAVRIPSWCDDYTILINGIKKDLSEKKGYVYMNLQSGDNVKLILMTKPKFMYANTKIPELTGMTSICYGPLVYCFEGVDNEEDILSLIADTTEEPAAKEYKDDVLGDIIAIEIAAYRLERSEDIYYCKKPKHEKVIARAVPYYTWSNRGENQMRVWIPYI